MAKLSRNLSPGLLDPREALFVAGNLGSLNAELPIVAADGCNTVTLDLRGTFNLTVEVSGTVDGTNWVPIVLRPINTAAVSYVASVAGTAAGVWAGSCSQYRQVRARVTAYTSGSATAVLLADNATLDSTLQGTITPSLVTTIGTAGAATTLTLTAPGVGLRHYLTLLSIGRFATATLTAGTAPVAITTTNLPGTLALSFPAEAAAQGTLERWREDFSFPIAAVAQNTATTIVCPATTSVIWRVTAGFYVAP